VADPGDEMAAGAAGRGPMRASHADREQAIEVLKAAFVQDRLDKDEFDARVGQAFASRTYAELAAVTADIPPAPSAPASARTARPPVPARRRPLVRAAAGSGLCLVIAAAALWLAGPNPYGSWARLCLLVALAAVVKAFGILANGVGTSVEQRRSRRQLPPRPGPGAPALEAERRGGSGHDPVPPGSRPDQTRTDLRSDSSRPQWPLSSGRDAQAPRGIRPVGDTG
jgi:DUF1707 SHOCT-like domain